MHGPGATPRTRPGPWRRPGRPIRGFGRSPDTGATTLRTLPAAGPARPPAVAGLASPTVRTRPASDPAFDFVCGLPTLPAPRAAPGKSRPGAAGAVTRGWHS